LKKGTPILVIDNGLVLGNMNGQNDMKKDKAAKKGSEKMEMKM